MGITQNIQERLVAIERTMVYDGSAVKAGTYIPEGFQASQCPIFINFPLPGTRVQVADTSYLITRQWSIKLYGRHENDGLRSENELRMYDLIDATYALFLPKQRLELNGEGLAFIETAYLQGDNGVSVEPYPDGGDESHLFYVVDFQMEISYESTCY